MMTTDYDQIPDSGNAPPAAVEFRAGEAADELVFSGRVGLDEAGRVHEEALRLAAGSRPVVYDWSGAEHICMGVWQVLLALEAARAARGQAVPRVAGDNAGIRRVLELAGITGHFPCLDKGL